MAKERKLEQMVRNAQRMEQRVEKVRRQLKKRIFSGKAEGLVSAEVQGDNKLVKLTVAPRLLIPEKASEVETLIMQAVNAALEQAEKVTDQEISKAVQGFSVPGMGV